MEVMQIGVDHARAREVRGAGKVAPLTLQQEWAVNHWMHRGNLYVIGCAIRVDGPLNIVLLRRSLDEVLRRHDALRTRLVSSNGTLEQQVDERCKAAAIEIIDLCESPDEGREDKALDLIGAMFRKQRDLAREDPANFQLLRFDEHAYLLACVIQHIVCDEISCRILLGEIWHLYGDFIQGRSSSLPDTPLQYSDYAIQQCRGRAFWLEEHGNYWALALAGARRVQLPYDEGLQSVDRFKGGYVQTCFSGALSSALHSLARRLQVTIATVMLSIYAIVLSYWSRQDDFVVPFAVPGRSELAQMKMIGQFAEFLPLRLRVRDDETTAAMVKRMSRLLLSASEHLDFGAIVTSSPEFFRGTSLNWFPKVGSTWIPTGWAARNDRPTLQLFPCRFPGPTEYSGKVTADMGCRLIDTGDCIVGAIRYRADLFSLASMERFLEDLKQVAERVAVGPECRISMARLEVRGPFAKAHGWSRE